jgi:hypothetical protein
MAETPIIGGCLCGTLRYRATGQPRSAGYCFCGDCRRASGSGFIGFLSFAASQIAITGEARQYHSKAARGTDAVRNFCPACGSLVFGGIFGTDTSHTIYAGSLDDPAQFRPGIAIFNRDRPAWMPLPPGLLVFETMPE